MSKIKPFRWKPMDVAFGENLLNPRRLVVEVSTQYESTRYTTCSQSGGIGYCSEYGLRTKEEWLAWIDRFAEDLTGRQLREAKEAVYADFVEPEFWLGFRKRYKETGDPWLKE